MLRELHIRDLGVIEDATLPLDAGFTVVTGETGAGKTMVVTGLGLVLGGRADAGLVRSGRGEAVVEAALELDPQHPARERAAEAGAAADEDELLLARTVSAAGRSRAHVGGRRAPIATLNDLAEDLVAVHGQADQWRLRRPAQHRALLDTFGGETVAGPLAQVAYLYTAWQEAKGELAGLVEGERTRLQEVELLTHQLEQIDAVDPQPGEDAELAGEAEVLGNAEDLRVGADLAHRLLSDPDSFSGDDVVGRIARAGDELSRIVGHDPRLAEVHRRLGELGVLAADVAGELSAYAADVEADPARLGVVQERRAALTDLTRRYGEDTAAVLAHRDTSRQRLLTLEGADERIEELTGRVDDLAKDLGAALERLTAARAAAAATLAETVEGELARLGMDRARVEIAVGARTDDAGARLPGPEGERTVSAEGADSVEIRVAANRGDPPRSVSKAASGGELSRIMLAIEVATAGSGRAQVPTFVFDEVDAGVGGRAALDVGARLAALARTSQVIVVTHLAQVAAHADRHLVVHKSHDQQVTSSDVRVVEGEYRLGELSRMMGGGDTEVGLTHARELLEQCRGSLSQPS
ncbi:DNA repair protein RecN [Janibacter cremeus]|uniref:DNA repair protein RecN n=1 Tax=Janibacter cremeus TaxID=1285192 RepID=A0A852VXY8_9MICO|nr:DNA repair protein RecN [Janibacter cremeus]NYF99523.1 DNA repair protein RecN (Recombination protein N) [Janibacter cremeus]